MRFRDQTRLDIGGGGPAGRAPGTVALVVAADHLISDMDAFVAACVAAAEGAREGFVMTLGVTPTAPTTGHGYIQPGGEIPGTGARRVERFIEKPDAATASRYIDQGYLWNSGSFLFRSDVMIAELAAHAPEVLAAALRRACGATRRKWVDILGGWSDTASALRSDLSAGA